MKTEYIWAEFIDTLDEEINGSFQVQYDENIPYEMKDRVREEFLEGLIKYMVFQVDMSKIKDMVDDYHYERYDD